MKKQYKGYAYGFKYGKEYEWYKKICSKKNKCTTYTDWYQHIKDKYENCDVERLQNFEKYLNWKIRRLERKTKSIDFAMDVIKYMIGIVLPVAALVVSVVTYSDSMQESIMCYMQQENIYSLESIKARIEGLADIIDFVKMAMDIAIEALIPWGVLYAFKMCKKKEIEFFEDYKECVRSVREEKSTKRQETIQCCKCDEEFGL